MAYVIVLVGGTGEGKTTYGRNMLKGKKHIALDYGDDFKGYNRYTDVHDIPAFLKIFEPTREKFTGGVVMIDEATMCFNNRGYSSELNKILVRKRHAKNTYVLIFHSLRQIPLYIKDFIDVVLLFKTNDSEQDAERFPNGSKILEAQQKLKNYKTNFGQKPEKHYKPMKILLK